jgi:hypothetical protein
MHELLNVNYPVKCGNFYSTCLVSSKNTNFSVHQNMLPVVLTAFNALDSGSIQMWDVMNNVAARILLFLHNLPAALAVCIVA